MRYNYIAGGGYNVVIEGKSGLSYSGKGIFYNIFKNGTTGVVDGGMDGLMVCNNTFIYTGSPTWIIALYDHGGTPPHPSGCIVKNNILIALGTGGISFIESYQDAAVNDIDYNLYYCPNGTLLFRHSSGLKTFAQWQALGYDTHSRVLSAAEYAALFTDAANDDYSLPAGSAAIGTGSNLGAAYDDGIDASTDWGSDTETPTIITKQQAAAWDCGAYIH